MKEMRSGGGGPNPVDKDDIFLLLDSYKNNIELSTTLLEQQKKLLEQQAEILKHQNKICENTDETLKRFDQCTINSVNLQKNFSDSITSIKVENAESHNRLKYSIWALSGAMVTIVISLMGLIVAIMDKYKIITLIANKLGVLIQ